MGWAGSLFALTLNTFNGNDLATDGREFTDDGSANPCTH